MLLSVLSFSVAILGAAVVLVIVLVLGLIIVKVVTSYVQTAQLFGKLRGVPEPPVPWWQRFTVGHNMLKYQVQMERGKAARQFLAWARSYGSVYQLRTVFGLPCVIVTSATGIQHVTSARNASKYKKIQLVTRSFTTLVGKDSLLIAEGENRRRLRRVVAPAMRHTSLVNLNRAFIRHAHALATTMLADNDRYDDVVEIIHKHSFALIIDACFGDRVVPASVMDDLRESYFAIIKEPPASAVRRFLLQTVFDFTPVDWFGYREETKKKICGTVTQLVNMVSEASGGAHRGLDKMSSKMETFKTVKDAPNLLTKLVSDAEQRDLLTADEAVSLVLTFVAAGQVTTSFSISWLLYNLATHAEWQSRVREEIALWDPDAEDALEVIDRYPILDRVIKESLRHDSPFGSLSRETVEPDNIDGYDIPAGMVVRFPIHAIQNDPTVWGADAFDFNPDRWLREDIQALAPHFAVFWHGSSGCIGQRFAILEMKTFAASILRQSVFKTRKGDPTPVASGFASPVGIKIHFEPSAAQQSG